MRLSILGRECDGRIPIIGGSAFLNALSLTRVIFTENFNQPSFVTEESSSNKFFSVRYRTHPLASPTLICSANSEQKGLEAANNDVENLKLCGSRSSHFLQCRRLQRDHFL